MTTKLAAPVHVAGDRYKWVALSNTTLGVLIATIDSSIVIISLPAIFAVTIMPASTTPLSSANSPTASASPPPR